MYSGLLLCYYMKSRSRVRLGAETLCWGAPRPACRKSGNLWISGSLGFVFRNRRSWFGSRVAVVLILTNLCIAVKQYMILLVYR